MQYTSGAVRMRAKWDGTLVALVVLVLGKLLERILNITNKAMTNGGGQGGLGVGEGEWWGFWSLWIPRALKSPNIERKSGVGTATTAATHQPQQPPRQMPPTTAGLILFGVTFIVLQSLDEMSLADIVFLVAHPHCLFVFI